MTVDENVITVSVTDGTPPYEYVWSDGTEGPVYVGWPGTVEVTVTDAKGCTVTREQWLEGVYNIVGVWEMVTFDGVPVGQYKEHHSTECPEIVVSKTSMYGSYEFGPGEYDSLFNYSITDITVDTQITYNANCEIEEDLPDTETETVETGEGTVYYNGTDLILNYFNGEEEPVIILGQDRIKIANEEYERI
ncbi:SprB repeat-containing protein [Aequorivita sp. F47161]|uniref:SprB repeat-containing protein n=1 Tax=Aequorivita vitellina TaxID=2874475 RepID=A0A9X1U4C9_9FLAO|nr:SprB repeat-containing protein [Aequorivita vitellina]MCG2420167.1 SprB repeat-containing protein [Aequorivita vitellina]